MLFSWLVNKLIKVLPTWAYIVLGVLVLVVLICGMVFGSYSEKPAKNKAKETTEYSMQTVKIESMDIPDVSFDKP